MSKAWEARLEGGPFDGDEGAIDLSPPKLWVVWCDKHQDTEWFAGWVRGAEIYCRDEADDASLTVKYVHSDIRNQDSLTRDTEAVA